MTDYSLNVERLAYCLENVVSSTLDEAQEVAPIIARRYDESRAADIRRLHYTPLWHAMDETAGDVADGGMLRPFEACGNPKCVWARQVLDA
jgi:hypothetical protein